jgi:hypothetical protein
VLRHFLPTRNHFTIRLVYSPWDMKNCFWQSRDEELTNVERRRKMPEVFQPRFFMWYFSSWRIFFSNFPSSERNHSVLNDTFPFTVLGDMPLLQNLEMGQRPEKAFFDSFYGSWKSNIGLTSCNGIKTFFFSTKKLYPENVLQSKRILLWTFK